MLNRLKITILSIVIFYLAIGGVFTYFCYPSVGWRGWRALSLVWPVSAWNVLITKQWQCDK